MKTICKFIFFALLISISAQGQPVSSVTADSLYAFFKIDPIADYEATLKTGRQLKAYYESRNDSCQLAKLSSRIAKCYERLGYQDSALQELHATESTALHCDPRTYLKNAIGQASVYIELENWDMVIDLVDEAENRLSGLLPDSIVNEIRVDKAIALVYSGRIDEAKKVFLNYYYTSLKSGDYGGQLTALSNLGALAGYTDDLDSAEYYLNKALKICGEHPCPGLIEILQNLATLASFRDDYTLSRFYLDSAIATAVNKNDIRTEAALYRELAVTLKGLNMYPEALSSMFDHSDLKDTVNKKEMIERVAEYQELFESEKKNRKIKELELEKLDSELRETKLKQNRNLLLFSGLGVLLLAIGLWSRLQYIKKTNVIISKEKDRSDELLLNILPYEVAQELKEKGQSEARDYEKVTVLFTDFEDFTVTAETLSAKALVDEINTCFKAFDEIIQRYKVEKIKTIGDAYMAAGGLHVPRTSEPVDVVKAAIDMQAFMLERKALRIAEKLPAFEMRVGIHTGPVVAGIVGVKKFQYDIWGDTVNTAARMESSGEVGKVNISQATYELLKSDPHFSFRSRGKIEAKGKGEMEMYFATQKESPDEHVKA